jgi:transcriptional regulator with XRE-family HTH domain
MTVQAIEAGTIPEWTRGDRLRKSLESAGMSVQEMADALGVSRTSISSWIHERNRPNRPSVMLWAMRTGVPLHWIETGHEPGSGLCGECAARDSNPEPAGYVTLRRAA